MSTIADTALRSVVGLIVLTAVFLAIWMARDSSARTGVMTVESVSESPELNSARNDRSPVTRTSITQQQLHELQVSPARNTPEIGAAR